ncbi:high mobility group-T protein-like [Convolutriloba macropyga]|uniref:high mobility group-T protein-like n=1 Tax=Convolutriloba macropyga TaxID=536237 RepID=UPI003F52097A
MAEFTTDVQMMLGGQSLLAAALGPPPAVPEVPVVAPAVAKTTQKKGRKPKDGKTKRVRAKKPADAPRRPKSAYMFFLAEFREQWKLANPDSKKVSEVAVAAGNAWRSLPPEKRAEYEQQSRASKDEYKSLISKYEEDHPKQANRPKKERAPGELKRPQSAYFFFLADFRLQFKEQHKGEVISVSVVGKAAGEKWKQLTPEEKKPYEDMSSASKSEYARMKMLTPAERVMVAAAATMQQQETGGAPNGLTAQPIPPPQQAGILV